VACVCVCAMATASPMFEENRDNHGLKLVPTPYGWRPIQCVHRWPSGTSIRDVVGENRTHVTLPDGSEVSLPRLPECMKEYDGTDERGHSNISDGWLDYADYYINRRADPTEYEYKFDGTYTIPSSPSQIGGLLYYFLGMENEGGSLGRTSLQTVLTYYYGWSMTSWSCCPNGQSHESTAITFFDPGDKVYGNMYESAEQSGTWIVESQFCSTFVGAGTCHTTWLNVTNSGREFVRIYATLMTYYVKRCVKLSSDVMTYSKMKLKTLNSQGVRQLQTIGWENHTPTSNCNGVTTIVSPAEVTINHN